MTAPDPASARRPEPLVEAPVASDPDQPTRQDSEGADGPARGDERRGGVGAWLRETALIVVSALVLSLLIKTFLVQAFFIPSSSMEDTLQVDDRVLVSKLTPGPFELDRGDVVVFKDPGGWLQTEPAAPRTGWQRLGNDVLTWVGLLPQDSGEHLIKRIVGLPGDTVECCDAEGRVTVDGVPLDETYVAAGSLPSEMEFSVEVPAGGLWVMGDNRQNSQDSRYKQGSAGGGAVPVDNVVGLAFVIVWPADRWGLLRNPGGTFAEVP